MGARLFVMLEKRAEAQVHGRNPRAQLTLVPRLLQSGLAYDFKRDQWLENGAP